MGNWQNDIVNQTITSVSVAPTTVAGYTYAWNVTLSAPLTLTPNVGGVYIYVCVDPNWYTSSGGGSWTNGFPPHYGVVGVSGNVVTIVGQYVPPGGAANWSYGTTITPTVGAAIITTPRMQRNWQWYRGASPISGATSAVYTLAPADAGSDITVVESGYRWNAPAVTTTNTSAPITAVANAGASTLVFLNNLNYLGAFSVGGNITFPNPIPAYQIQAMSINPNKFSGNTTIYISGGGNVPQYIGEFQIPASFVNSSDYYALPNAPLVRTANMVEPTEGQINASGVWGGVNPAGYGTHVIGASTKMLVNALNWYSYEYTNLFWRRPWNLNTTGQVENAFYVVDPNAVNGSGRTTTPRWTTGAICPIPSTLVGGVNYQTVFSSDIMSGVSGISIAVTQSSAPAAACWNTADIDATIAKVNTGAVVAVTPTTITFASSASSTPDFYKDHLLYISAGTGNTNTAYITAYNGTTKVATVTSSNGSASVWPSSAITNAQWTTPATVPTGVPPGTYLVVTTSASFLYPNSAGIKITGVVGMTQLNGNTYYTRSLNGADQWLLYTDPGLTTKVDGSTFSAYVSGGLTDATPVPGSTYITRPRLVARQLCGRFDPNTIGGDPPFQNAIDDQISAIWGYGSTPRGMVIPNGTRSLLFFGGGSDGPYRYGPVNGIATNRNDGPLCWDPVNTSTGPHTYPYTFRIWAYDLAELAEVYNGTGGKTFNNVLPYGVFSFVLPEGANGSITGAAYDPATRRIFIGLGNGPFGQARIHVYEVTNAVAVP
jgi:hypothetical protein